MRIILSCLSLLLVPIAYGQEPECYRVAPEAAKVIAEARKDRCEVSCRGCGCKGGSGYRERNGRKQCVSWEALIQTCGLAPHANCDRECTPVVAVCEAPRVPAPRPAG